MHELYNTPTLQDVAPDLLSIINEYTTDDFNYYGLSDWSSIVGKVLNNADITPII